METLLKIPGTNIRIGVVEPIGGVEQFLAGSRDLLTDEQRYDEQLIDRFKNVRFEGRAPLLPSRKIGDDELIELPDHADRTLLSGETYDISDNRDYFDGQFVSEYIVAVSDDEPLTIQFGCRVVFDLMGLPCDTYVDELPPDGSIELTHFYVRGECCGRHYPAVCLRHFGRAVQGYVERLHERPGRYTCHGKHYSELAGTLASNMLARVFYQVEHGQTVKSLSLVCMPEKRRSLLPFRMPVRASA